MSTLSIDPQTSERIENAIHSDASPVGIDAKKTHVIIIHMLEQLGRRLDVIESRISELEARK
jgi:hypothetical protein